MTEMMPPAMIHRAGMKRIVGSGGGLCRNPILKTQVNIIYGTFDTFKKSCVELLQFLLSGSGDLQTTS